MREILYFNTNHELNQHSLEQFLSETVGLKHFQWCENLNEYFLHLEGEADKSKIYIEFRKSDRGFNHHYSVEAFHQPEFSLARIIETLKDLAKTENIQILASDDEINPWTWVLIEPDGFASSIETEDDDLVIEGGFNFPFGDFRTKNKLTEKEIKKLKQIVSGVYPDVELEYATDGPVIDCEFNQVKESFAALAGFDHHYEICPLGKNSWLDKETKSLLLVFQLSEFHRQTGIDLCVFPSNYSEVKNIEGGSDSTQHCIVITAKGQEKIVYKERRKSWLK